MIGFSGLGGGRKPRSFEYKPRHFDDQAEAREERRRAILGEKYGEGDYQPGVLIREGRMRRLQERERGGQRRTKRTLIRTAIFFILVVAVLYFMSDILGAMVGMTK